MRKNNLRQYVAFLAAVGLATALAPLNAAGSTVVVTPTPPAATVAPVVPESYVWDGNEYVGVVGDNYYYLGPGNVWMTMDKQQMRRFEKWEHNHKDWRAHETHNVKYRNGPPPNVLPMRDMHQNNPPLWEKGGNPSNPGRGYGQDVNTPGGP